MLTKTSKTHKMPLTQYQINSMQTATTNNKTTAPALKKRGRPSLPDSEKKLPRNRKTGRTYPIRDVGIDEEKWNHALSQPGGASEYIRRLIDQDIKQNKTPTG